MPYLQLDGLQYPLERGETSVGAGPEARVRLQGVQREGVFAILTLGDDGSVIVRKAGGIGIKVNGLELPEQPSPLLHGDKLEVLGQALIFGDDRRAGSTLYMPSVEAGFTTARQASARALATGGRLVSLMDGREYNIPEYGLVIGREPSCEVVVPSTEVSRRHAMLAPTTEGYLLTDMSTNGVLVNGARIVVPQLLDPGDVLRIGDEEFRFHADSTPAAHAPVATLEGIGTSPISGQKFEIGTPIAHIGRGDHNDVVLTDDSVSESHARLQRRDDGFWEIVDLGSTNGTYVAGRRIEDVMPLDEGSDVRFGGVKCIFRSVEQEVVRPREARVIAPPLPRAGAQPMRAGGNRPGQTSARPAKGESTSQPKGAPVIVLVLLAVLLLVIALILA